MSLFFIYKPVVQQSAIGDVLTFCFENPDLNVSMTADGNNVLD
jgi:hypothetical protein